MAKFTTDLGPITSNGKPTDRVMARVLERGEPTMGIALKPGDDVVTLTVKSALSGEFETVVVSLAELKALIAKAESA